MIIKYATKEPAEGNDKLIRNLDLSFSRIGSNLSIPLFDGGSALHNLERIRLPDFRVDPFRNVQKPRRRAGA